MKFNKKQTGKSADYCRLLVEPCCKQILASGTPPLPKFYNYVFATLAHQRPIVKHFITIMLHQNI